MSRLVPDPAWLAALRAGADQLPDAPRVPLWAGTVVIGSVEPGLLRELGLPSGVAGEVVRDGQPGWVVHGDLTGSLDAIALALRGAGWAHAWRDEQLAVTDMQGRRLGSVERAVVRCLGITTFAVHLAGVAPDGRHWVQQRSLTKANDPGLWDTLMGGMVPASDSMEQALERETWEEAGLRIGQLSQLRHGGRILIRRPTGSGRGGYVVEYLDWYRSVVPKGTVPVNQDGEVAQFLLTAPDELLARLERDEFTMEAALVLIDAGL
ncbi:MAG: NUDIX domain-containing protein [Ramlibacter sp.]